MHLQSRKPDRFLSRFLFTARLLPICLWLIMPTLFTLTANAAETIPANLIWGSQLSVTSTVSSRDSRFPLTQLTDKTTSDASPFNGFASSSFTGTITLNLDKNYTLNGLMLWNDINVEAEGIAEFSLVFYNAAGLKIGTSALFTAPVGKKDASTYTFNSIEGVRRVDVVISKTHGYWGIEMREIVLLNALPDNFLGGAAITPTSTIAPRSSRWPLSQLTDQIASDASPFNGFAASVYSGTISLTLDKDYTLQGFMLWNDINVQSEGISSFSLNFFDSSGILIGKTSSFTAQLGALAPSTFNFPLIEKVRRVDLVIANSYGYYGIEIRELGFLIQPDWAMKGNSTLGAQQFAKLCVGCHGTEGRSSSNPINLQNLKAAEAQLNLAKFIFQYMPKSNPTACANTNNDNCAANIATYLRSLGPQQSVSCDATSQAFGMRTLRLLSKRELKNSLIDLGIAYASELTDDLFTQDAVYTKSKFPIHTHVTTAIDDNRMDALLFASDKLAVPSATRLRNSWGCGTNATTCASSFLTLAERIFRRPLTADERTTYTAFFTKYGAQVGTEVAIAAAITSPQFLYRSELGTRVRDALSTPANFGTWLNLQNLDPDAYILDNYEYATLLAYTYTGTTPDATLLQAARNNQLNTELAVNVQIDRLLLTARGREHIVEFGANWMRTDDVLTANRPAYPEFTDDIKKDMAKEVRELFGYVFFTANTPFSQLYSADYSVVNKRLAQYYGVTNFSGTDTDWKATVLPNRGGIIGTGALSVGNSQPDRSGPIKKAVDIRELMLCHHIGSPPTDLNATSKRAELLLVAVNREANVGDLTTREYYEIITDDPVCAQCHERSINPLFGIDDIDHLGKFRTTMKGLGPNGMYGLQVDNSGVLYGLGSIDDTDSLTFQGSKDLGKKIAELPAVRECLVTNSFRYATGLPLNKYSYSTLEGGQDNEPAKLTPVQEGTFACARNQLIDAYNAGNSSAKSLYRRIGTLDLVRLRKPVEPSQVKQ